ncbi:hypothetical protein NL676_023906 [Syzygium grande]|nr:hypothetical protein NL676_023906 [Syzygium grande]
MFVAFGRADVSEHAVFGLVFALLFRATYKGYADTIRLLLFTDASQGRQDKEGVVSIRMAIFSRLSREEEVGAPYSFCLALH